MNLSGIWQDDELRHEILGELRAQAEREGRARPDESLESTRPRIQVGSTEEAIVRRVGRPVLLVQDGTFTRPKSGVWNARLALARLPIDKGIAAVGRIELTNHPDFEWVGTGWLLAPDVMVTNRHVAGEFVTRATQMSFAVSPLGNTIEPRIDFRAEHERPASDEVAIAKPLFVSPDGAPDVALFKLAKPVKTSPVSLAAEAIEAKEPVVTIGYPAWDGRRNPGPDMDRIFDGIYDVKRLAPGLITNARADLVQHDCSTLGGNSGSLVLSMKSGAALALHFSGRFRESNYAVPAPVIAEIARQHGVL
jgi:endonuclease G